MNRAEQGQRYNIRTPRHPELVSGSHGCRMRAENIQEVNAGKILNIDANCETPSLTLQDDVVADDIQVLCHCETRGTSGAAIQDDLATKLVKYFRSLFPLSCSPRLAFTLSEVLITLTIIGVVAAMTLPAVINNIQDAQYKAAWKKEYSIINQAYEKMKYDNGGDLSAYLDRPTGNYFPDPFVNEFASYFSTNKKCLMVAYNIEKVCGTNKNLTNYKTLSGGYVNEYNLFYGNMILLDGAHLFFRTYWQGKFLIWVDVNGYGKKPNTLGKDLYGVIITKDKVLPMGAVGTSLDGTCNSSEIICPSGQGFQAGSCAGAGCSAEVLYK